MESVKIYAQQHQVANAQILPEDNKLFTGIFLKPYLVV
jgi:hypothetical protein